MKIAHSAVYELPLPEGHRFPMAKYGLVPQQLIYEGVCHEEDFFAPEPMHLDVVLETHNETYVSYLLNGTLDPKIIRKIGLPFSDALVRRELVISQGTLDCCFFALEQGCAGNVAGGTHHAYVDSGEGFCLLNDFAMAANHLLNRKLVHKILVVDLDVHQGNGTAKIFEHDPRVFTFSMHGADNYPAKKEKSDLDIPLPTGTTGNEYLPLLTTTLQNLIAQEKPEIIFYVCGVDVLAQDKLGKLNLTMTDCEVRDRIVFSEAKKNGIPVVFALAGGYSPKIGDIVNAHCNTFKAANDIYF